MSLKKPYTIKDFNPPSVQKLDQNTDILYTSKLESRWKNVNTSQVSYIYQSMQTGEVSFSATGSATVAKSFGFKEKYGTVLFAIAHAKSISVTAHVTDVTSTGITIECAPRQTIDGATASSSLLLFSQATTAVVSVYYCVIGSDS